MKQFAVYEAKTRFSELLAEVERGEQVTITRHGVAVARLVSATAPARRGAAASQRHRVQAVFQALAEARSDLSLDIPLRQAIEAGRD